MKHVITDDVDVNVRVDIPTEDVVEIIEQVRDAVVTVVVIAGVTHILKKWLTE